MSAQTSKLTLTARALRIPMRQSFKHASAERKVTDSVWVEVAREGLRGIGEGCPRIYVTGETTEGALAWIESIRPHLENEIGNLEELRQWVNARRAEIDRNPAAWCAVEIAILDLLAREQGLSIERLLGVTPRRSFAYTAVLGDEAPEKFAGTVRKYLKYGFWDFKLKIVGSAADDDAKITAITDLTGSPLGLLAQPLRVASAIRGARNPLSTRLRLDANNAWAGRVDEAIRYLGAVQRATPLLGVEEPVAARALADMSRISVECGLPIILDESFCRVEDLGLFASQRGAWIANLRVSKIGGLLRSLEAIAELRRLGWKIIVGAQVGETSVLSRAALVAAAAAGDSLLAQEGAFGTLLLERDAVTPEVRFGLGGMLRHPGPEVAGLGLSPASEEAV